MNLYNDKALLVQLNISEWSARKRDKRVTAEVAQANNADISVGNYNKNLLPLGDYLHKVHLKTRAVRKDFHVNTLPWLLDGSNMLPSKNYLNFMTRYRGFKSEWEVLAQDFFDHYEGLVYTVQHSLGGMYNPDDYPTLDEVMAKFKMDLVVLDIPSGDFRVELADSELDSLKSDMELRIAKGYSDATKEVWQRLYDKVEWFVARMAKPEAVIQEPTYAAMAELCELLPKLNVTGDADLDRMCHEVSFKLANFHVQSIRNDPDLRRTASADADAIMAQMKGFMGG